MTHNYPVNFKLVHFLLWINGSHQSPNFETFECSRENVPYFSCHFWKHNSVFLQSFYQSSVPSNIAPLYFITSNIIFCSHRQPITGQIFEIFECKDQNLLNSFCQFWTDKSIAFQSLYHSPVSWKITSLYLFSSNIINFCQNQPIKVQVFETFECSSQNSSNSWCQFWNDKSIPLQIFHHCSVSLHITPL